MARRSGSLTVVGMASAARAPTPPQKLGGGMSLWLDVAAAYQFEDRVGQESLFQACAAADRASSLREAIARDGEVVMSRQGPKDHPLLKHELGARSFTVRTLQRLGLDLEPIGRPARG
jgi:hypothetical protein